MMKSPMKTFQKGLRQCGVIVASVLTAGALFVGCGSTDAVVPSGDGFDDGQFVTVRDIGDASSARGGRQGIPVQEPDGTSGAIETTVVETDIVDSGESGSIVTGRFSMTIPTGAVDSETEFKLTHDPNNPQITCVLEPHAALFNVPVAVTFDLNGTDAYLHDDVRAQWFDESTRQWRDVPSEWNPDTQILTGYFDHFCSGRAGW